MSNDEFTSVAVFKWNEDTPPLLPVDDPRRISRDEGEELTYLTSRAAAVALLNALKDRDYVAPQARADTERGCWYFFMSSGGRDYTVHVYWTGIDNSDYLAAAPSLNRGCMASLFLRPAQGEALRPACDALREALSRLDAVTDLHWLTEREFDACYCHGAPLPAARRQG